MGDSELDALSKELFEWHVHWNPVFATSVGIHEHDRLLPKGTLDAQLEEGAKVRGYLSRVESIPAKDLSPPKRVDRGVLRNALRLWAFQAEDLRLWEAMPQGADVVGDALFYLFMREFAPVKVRMESIAARLERAPTFLAETRTRVRSPNRLLCEIALETTESLPGFLRVIQSAAKESLEPADRTYLDESAAKAAEALQEYARWIKSDRLPRAKDKVGIGTTKFRKLLRLRELGLTLEEILEIGRRYLRESQAELVRLAGEVKPGASVAEAKEIVKGDHPDTFPETLAYTAKTMEDARRFLREKNLVTIPANEELRVIETPSYLRHVIPFAAYNAPPKFEERQVGVYMVTPPGDRPEMLKELSYAGIRNTAVHEGYPGHHLQLTCANLNPSYARLMASAVSTSAVETIEGWAHYCEDMMKEAGFSADPATKVVQMLDQVWRACRILIDAELHCGRMTFDEAVEMLVKEAGMERPGAVAEVKRYAFSPTYPLSYLVGKELLLRLKADVRDGLGKGYSDKLFHDTILYAGSLPMKYMREIFEHKVRELRRLEAQGV